MLKTLIHKNIRYHIKSYLLFILCTVLSVATLFAFSTLVLNPSIKLALVDDHIKTLLRVSQAVVLIFIFFMINYAIKVFTKQKERDYAIFMMVGMSQKKLHGLNFRELATILLHSLLWGQVLGLGLAYGFYWVFRYALNYRTISFQISLLNILWVSGIISMVYGLNWLVNKRRLNKVSPVVLMKESKFKPKEGHWLLAVLGLFSLPLYLYKIYAYKALDLSSQYGLKPIHYFLLIMVSMGLILFNVDSLYMKLIKKSPKVYLAKLQSLSVFRLQYALSKKILYVLSLVSLLVVVLLSTVLSTYLQAKALVDVSQPYDLIYTSHAQNTRPLSHPSIVDQRSIDYLQASQTLFLSDPDKQGGNKVILLSDETYAELTGRQLDLSREDYVSHLNDSYEATDQVFPYDQSQLKVDNREMALKFKGQYRGILWNEKFLETKSLVIISKDNFEALASSNKHLHLINLSQQEVPHDLKASLDRQGFDYQSKYDYYLTFKQSSGSRLFIVVFIAFLFLTSALWVQVLKVYEDVRVYGSRYQKLKLLGLSDKKHSRLLRRECLILNLVPGLLGSLLGFAYIRLISIGTSHASHFKISMSLFILAYLILNLVFSWTLSQRVKKRVVTA